jgi:hypothetical protein
MYIKVGTETEFIRGSAWFWLYSKGLCHLIKSRKENAWEKGFLESHCLILSVLKKPHLSEHRRHLSPLWIRLGRPSHQ